MTDDWSTFRNLRSEPVEWKNDPEWLAAHEGKVVTVRYVMSLADLIDTAYMEGMNEYLDEQTPGATLADITYVFGQPDRGDDLGNQNVIIEATGWVNL